MMQPMRTTTDLPGATHARVTDLARRQRRSISAVVADLTARGLDSLADRAPGLVTDAHGLTALDLAAPISQEDVARFLEDDE